MVEADPLHEWRIVWLFVVAGLSHIKNAHHLHLSIGGAFLNRFGCGGSTLRLVMKEIVELSEKALAPAALTWKRNECFSLSRVFDLSRGGKLAANPLCSTGEGRSRSRRWFWDHGKEGVREKNKRTAYLLDVKHGGGKGPLTASWMLSRGEQSWMGSSQRAHRWSTDGGEHAESMRRGREKGIDKGIDTYERVINIGANLSNDPELTGADGCSWRPVLHAK